MGSTGLTHVQFSLHPQTYYRRPILSSHRLVFQHHSFLNVSLSKLCNRTYVSHVPTVRISPTEFYILTFANTTNLSRSFRYTTKYLGKWHGKLKCTAGAFLIR